MSKIGLIGGTGPESTVIYYRELTKQVCEACGNFPNLVIESLSVFDVLGYCERKDYKGLASYLSRGVENLERAGAEYAAFTGITPHIVFDEVQKRSSIPLVSMLETSAAYAEKAGFGRVALLGTIPTMREGFFQRAFAEKGIETVVPAEEEMQYIGEKISSELEFGVVRKDTSDNLADIANRLITEEKAEAIVLGCTELPLVFENVELAVPYIDVMRIHIERLAALALN